VDAGRPRALCEIVDFSQASVAMKCVQILKESLFKYNFPKSCVLSDLP
jgi:hypothetical protein